MKKVLILSLLFLPFIFTSCGPDGLFKPTPQPAAVLPPITTEGLNTAGCLIDGEVWLPKSGGGFRPGVHCNYYPRIEGTDQRFWGALQLDLARHSNDDSEGFIQISHGWLFDTTTYSLHRNHDNPDRYGGGVRLVGFIDGSFQTTTNPNNRLTILKLDTVNRIISGTFQFDVINEDDVTDTIQIREGRFDVRFTY